MNSTEILELVGGAALLLAAAFLVWQRDAVAEASAEWNRLKYDSRVTLLDRPKAERARGAFKTGPLDTLLVLIVAGVLLLAGVSLLYNALA